jgi:hypothetical protein
MRRIIQQGETVKAHLLMIQVLYISFFLFLMSGTCPYIFYYFFLYTVSAHKFRPQESQSDVLGDLRRMISLIVGSFKTFFVCNWSITLFFIYHTKYRCFLRLWISHYGLLIVFDRRTNDGCMQSPHDTGTFRWSLAISQLFLSKSFFYVTGLSRYPLSITHSTDASLDCESVTRCCSSLSTDN